MRTPTTITNAADCLQHVKYAIDEDDFRLAVLLIELLVAQECHKALIETIEERHREVMAIITAPFREIAE